MQSTIVWSSQLNNTKSFRIDAEYYHPKAIEYELKIVQQFHGQSIKTIGCKVVSGPFGSSLKSEAYLDSGVPFIRISDLRDFIISDDKLIYISEEDNDRLSSSKLNVGDIVLSKVGNTIGIASIVTPSIGYCNISENNIGIKMPAGMDDKEKSFLVTYLNSLPGQNQILRAISGNAQPKLNVADIEEVKVPHVSDALMLLIHNSFESSTSLIQQSESTFKEAENILLSELGLTHWQPKHQLTFIKNYSNTQQEGRIDAEYYQPKYDEIINAIKSYSGGWDTLGNLVHIKKCIEVGSTQYLDEGIPFVRVSNISPFEITEEKYISDSLYKELTPQEDNIPFEKSKNHQPRQGEILFSKDGTPGIAYYLKDEPPNMIPSGGILRLKSKTDKVNNEYLTLVLNSLLTQEQVNRDVGGSIILHWRPDQVKKTVIPILSEKKQSEIQQKVTESFHLRKQSKHLLEAAKKAVEMAIEQDEETAINWLKNEVETVGVTDASGL